MHLRSISILNRKVAASCEMDATEQLRRIPFLPVGETGPAAAPLGLGKSTYRYRGRHRWAPEKGHESSKHGMCNLALSDEYSMRTVTTESLCTRS